MIISYDIFALDANIFSKEQIYDIQAEILKGFVQ